MQKLDSEIFFLWEYQKDFCTHILTVEPNKNVFHGNGLVSRFFLPVLPFFATPQYVAYDQRNAIQGERQQPVPLA